MEQYRRVDLKSLATVHLLLCRFQYQARPSGALGNGFRRSTAQENYARIELLDTSRLAMGLLQHEKGPSLRNAPCVQ
jgi:hypothetical protein